ncbi:FtsX-like permease family protein [Phenylobacterium sp.]|uniref:FtsX-like permease family protein n=1 Tax=Phenylobacterium sp. TaxID=1871053 RepID=UPI002CDECE20|nr:FtsX-like permease family protein [Phenylobacterium sp.]HLZ77039.1 FtsX-like permease family protein [Phenylobacterium sp.]
MLRSYLAAALRNLGRNRLYAGITIAGLAIGFAAAMLVALFVRDEYSYDKFIPGWQRTYRISQLVTAPGGKTSDNAYTPVPLAAALRFEFPEMEEVSRFAFGGFPPEVRHGEISAAEQGVQFVDPNFFRIMPMPKVAGDIAHGLDAPDTVIVDLSTARKYFGRDTPIGEILMVDKHPLRVVAVLQDLPSNTEINGNLFVSALAPNSVMNDPAYNMWAGNRLNTYFRLKPGASLASVMARMPAFVKRYDSNSTDANTVRMVPINVADIHMRRAMSTQFDKAPADPGIVASIGAVGALIVLVAAINFVTLMTARAARRAVEVGVRKAAGASRRDLIVQFMGEAFVYVLLAGLVSVALAELLLPAFNLLVQRRIHFDYLHDPGLAAGIFGVLLLVALLAGAYPAFVLSRFRPAAVLKGGPVQGAGGAGVRQVLVVLQFSVLIALILGAGTIYRQTMFSIKASTRLDNDQVMLLFAQPCTDTLRDQVRRVPGVINAACSSGDTLALMDNEVTVTAGRHKNPYVVLSPVDPNFFDVYRLKPVAGRFYDPNRPADAANGATFHQPLVINETAVREMGFASPAQAVGQSIVWDGLADPGCTGRCWSGTTRLPSLIIGVVPDFSFASARTKIGAAILPIAQKSGGQYDSMALNVRLDPAMKAQALPAIDKVWKRFGNGPIIRYFVDQFLLRWYIDTIVQGAVITACALIALSIACLGLFALSAYTTERRTKEIGIRKAMGANSGDILKLLLWQFTKPVLWASALAVPAAWFAMNWWLQGFVYKVPLAPWTFVAAVGLAVLIAWGTVFVHALRVARARPVGALRYE